MNTYLKRHVSKTKHPPNKIEESKSQRHSVETPDKSDNSESSSSNNLTIEAVKYLNSEQFLNNFEAVGSIKLWESYSDVDKENINRSNLLQQTNVADQPENKYSHPSLMALNKLLINKNSKLEEFSIFTKIVFIV